MPRYTVSKKDLQTGAMIEAKEHPWASPTRARRIARDHLQEKGPAAYRIEKLVDKIENRVNKRMGSVPLKRRMPPLPFDPMRDSPFY